MESAPLPLRAVIDSVQFGIPSEKTVRSQSVVQLASASMSSGGVPVPQGVVDDAMGVTHDNRLCKTCGNTTLSECTGHMGHIECPQPVPNVFFTTKLSYVLRSVCWQCSRLLYAGDDADTKRLSEIANKCKKRHRCISMQDAVRIRRAEARVQRAILKGEAPKDEDVMASQFEPDADLDDLLAETGELEEARYCGAYQPYEFKTMDNQFTKKDPMFPYACIDLTEDDYTMWQTVEQEPPKFTPRVIKEILTNITDSDVRDMGFNPEHAHPSSMVWTALPVPPMSLRPSRGGRTSTSRSEDDLSGLVKEVYRASLNVSSEEEPNFAMYRFRGQESTSWRTLFGSNDIAKEARDIKLREMYETFASWVARYQHDKRNNMNKFATTKRRKIALSSPLNPPKGKENWIRQYVMGKRGNYTIRAPLSCHNGHICDVYIPRVLAMKVGCPETVNALNFQRLSIMVRNGPHVYPGANELIHRNGTRVDLSVVDRNTVRLQFGDRVVRHMVDAESGLGMTDYVLVNRQPTLHQFSIRGLRVRVWDNLTLGLHLSLTEGLNADFDGDEATVVVAVSPESRTEASILMSPFENMMKDGRSIVSFVQHSPAGAYMLTSEDLYVSKSQLSTLLDAWRSDWCPQVNPVDRMCASNCRRKTFVSGRHVFEFFLPHNLTVTGLIDHGKYVKDAPRLSKKLLNKTRGVVDSVFRQYGSRYCINWMSAMCRIFEVSVEIFGMTFGVCDVAVDIDADVKKQSNALIQRADELHLGDTHHPGDDVFREERIVTLLDRARHVIGQHLLDRLSMDCPERILVESGSKGSRINIVQNGGLIGTQRNHRSTRYDQSLSCMFKCKSPSDRWGLVRTSFMEGQRPHEFFVHASSSRNGLVSTAIGTQDVGYGQRQQQRSMEDLVTRSGQVVNSAGDLVMHRYGYNGLEPNVTCGNTIRISKRANRLEWYRCPGSTWHFKRMRTLWTRLNAPRVEAALKRYDGWNVWAPAPLPFDMVIPRHADPVDYGLPDDTLDPQESMELVRALWIRVVRENLVFPTLKVELVFWDHMSYRSLCEYGVSNQTLGALLAEVYRHYAVGAIPEGESVGSITASYVSEPVTQATLNEFHNAGNRSSITNVGDLERILRASKDDEQMARCSMRIYLRDFPDDNEQMSNYARRFLVEDHASTYIQRIYVHYHEFPHNVLSNHRVKRITHEDGREKDLLMIFELDREKCIREFLSPFEIANRMYQRMVDQETTCVSVEEIPNLLAVSYSDIWSDKSEMWWISVSVSPDSECVTRVRDALAAEIGAFVEVNRETTSTITGAITEILMSTVVRGIPRISNFKVGRDPGGRPYIGTTGTNLHEALKLPRVDRTLSSSSSVMETYNMFDVDAARECIVYYIHDILESCGSHIKRCHPELLACHMTATGGVRAITENGTHRKDNIFQSASFERPLQNFLDAASTGGVDDINGMTAPMIVARPIDRGPQRVRLKSIPEFKPDTNMRWDHTERVPVASTSCRDLRQYFVEQLPSDGGGGGARKRRGGGGTGEAVVRRRRVDKRREEASTVKLTQSKKTSFERKRVVKPEEVSFTGEFEPIKF